jgi:Family of unknown function (DUF6504)
MGRVYREPVDVQAGEDGRPARFAWRERLYTVSAVQEHWLVNREWWRETAPVPVRAELQFWRVEARVDQDQPAGIYELRRDAAVGTWTLRRVAD